MRSQLGEYRLINRSALKMLNDQKQTGKDAGALEKAMAKPAVSARTLADKSSGHISEMMIQDSAKGIADAAKSLQECSGAKAGAVHLAKKLLQTEENNVRQLRQFL